MSKKYRLISSVTCPWVQRSVILLRAKNVDFDVTYINLLEKPDWFLKISPHGKVPVLLVDDQPLFESNAISEFLDEMIEPQLHPEDPIKRARNRAWNDFIRDFANAINGINYAKSKEEMEMVWRRHQRPSPALKERLEKNAAMMVLISTATSSASSTPHMHHFCKGFRLWKAFSEPAY